MILEITASLVEMSFRYLFSGTGITFATLALVFGIAIIRSFFVLGFYNMVLFRHAKLAEELQRKRNEKMLLLISNLYVETVQLNKSIQYAEEITRSCYGLYRELKADSYEQYSKTALNLAGQVHEIKKDNQRIYAGLSKLIINENLSDTMNIQEILYIVVETNRRYSQLLEKSIEFRIDIMGQHDLYQTFVVLSLLNNLVSNAVEVIQKEGKISISVEQNEDMVYFQVSDNGPGIHTKKKDLIFQPGYTTKYDTSGTPSNGIGLTYVKDMVEKMGGTIELLDNTAQNMTTFHIQIPVESLRLKG
ncbi:sensor histidine kinase [Tepidibacillus marianensis]|uniref:ATP-binding protein n=1 Tax=Tepidibacillus marianensis TaxID=3131995 RepID=UPI0030D26750